MTTLRAFHGDPTIKAALLARLRAHALADEIVQGQYWEDGKGCDLGCSLYEPGDPDDDNDSSIHSRYEERYGIPRPLVYLFDRIFEELPNEEAKTWPLRHTEAIAVGADLSLIVPRFLLWLLIDEEAGVIRFASSQGKIAIQRVARLYQRMLAGKSVSQQEWLKVRAAAYTAAYAGDAAAAAAYAAAAAAYAAAAAAYAAADAADDAAAAADAADDAAADDAAAAAADARQAHYQRIAKTLLSLLADTPHT